VARSTRLQEPGGIYHVTARGNRRQPIFHDERDNYLFLNILASVVRRKGWRCHSYCLMPNHYHLLIGTPEPNLSTGMQLLNGRHAQWFNHAHSLDGHLFQGRFHSVLVKSEWHLVELSRYIVLNPVRAGLCAEPQQWPWTSYRALIGSSTPPEFLTVGWILQQFDPLPARARQKFDDFVRVGMRFHETRSG
jgi:REP element-mobilizing transposase RayT